MGPRPLTRDLRDFMGTLVIVPMVVLLYGTHWDGPVRIDHRWLVPVLWLSWAGLRRIAGAAGEPGGAERVFEAWRRFDPVVAGALVYGVLFRVPRSWIVPIALGAVLIGGLALLRRASGPVLVSLLTAFIVFGVVLPRAFRTLLIARIAGAHALDVDHRLSPDGGEINSDGARFFGEPGELADEDFVALFMGDSFTFGWSLPYEDAYPYQLEKLAREAGCDPTVRVVNMGWTSSSPLLSLRLLREVGWEYRPDLVVYSLDMTDFHDDLRYERALREGRDLQLDLPAMLERLVATELPWARGALPPLALLTAELRGKGEGDAPSLEDLELPGPNDRYFITEHPLDETRAAIERGVMKNLAEWHAFASEELGARTAVVIYPRAYQYSKRESIDSWEASLHTRLGPYAREPFRYFAERAAELPYPVLDILPAFEASRQFPLYFRTDPHWTRLGARVAARAVFAALRDRGMLPCGGGGEGGEGGEPMAR